MTTTSQNTFVSRPDLPSTQRPLPVAVVRQRISGARLGAEVVVFPAFLALRAWVLMLVLGHFGLTQFGFWDAALGCIGFAVLRGLKGDYLSWTLPHGARQ